MFNFQSPLVHLAATAVSSNNNPLLFPPALEEATLSAPAHLAIVLLGTAVSPAVAVPLIPLPVFPSTPVPREVPPLEPASPEAALPAILAFLVAAALPLQPKIPSV